MHSILLRVHVVCLLVTYALEVWGGTLTTAVHRNDLVSAMPTTLYRRIAVDRYADRPKVLPVIFRRSMATDGRRKSVEVWNWDYWCQQQPQKGNCSTHRIKYFYNTQLDECQSFSYSGCHGNKNNFDSMVECYRYCKGAAFMDVKHIKKSKACSLQPSTGLCIAVFNKFYYDVNAGTCKEFVYTGCGGNQNRFGTKYKCMEKCGKHSAFVEDK